MRVGETHRAAVPETLSRLRLVIRGAVQGVGFRPFVYRLATELGLNGWVSNSPEGVIIEVEGETQTLDTFLLRIEKEKPARAIIQSLEPLFLDPAGLNDFSIRPSEGSGSKRTLILPDIASCPDCVREVFDPSDRRYLYPFTNCTNCGPRFTIIESLPYDRANTTMKKFPMCEDCSREYRDPLDRRFHAQPNACPKCGPQLMMWDETGIERSSGHEALLEALEALRSGKIVAVKGIGGFHLMVDARSDEAVDRLRRRKHREEKPLALMYPSLESVKEDCEVSSLEERLLLSPEAPIVLLRRAGRNEKFEIRSSKRSIVPSVAPNNPYLGVMLPYSPLHHILLRGLGFPVVATSGNLSEEPICIDESEVMERLSGIADCFLVHNRPIARHVDDSIVRIIGGREFVLRRARGYAPLPIRVHTPLIPTIGVGAHLKNTVAISVGQDIFVSQHIGDLETVQSFHAFTRVIEDFRRLYECDPRSVSADVHPDYLSTQYAHQVGWPVNEVQHHNAHVLACMAENEIEGQVLGVCWDGTGYGLDGTIWGGEFLVVHDASFQRVAHLRTFRLPGGEKAIREPRRSAVSVLFEVFGDRMDDVQDLPALRACSERELELWVAMLRKGVNAPVTSSAGRLFDAVASIAGLRHVTQYEGQAAMELEFAVAGSQTDEAYPFSVADFQLPIEGADWETRKSKIENSPLPKILDWQAMIPELIRDLRNGTPIASISARFHNGLIEAMLRVVELVGQERVVLTGGCFQNKYLTERAIQRLREKGYRPYWHQRIPPNDGGISLGQVVATGLRNADRTRLKKGRVHLAEVDIPIGA
jgi:hydrogenase maturation protein HypF